MKGGKGNGSFSTKQSKSFFQKILQKYLSFLTCFMVYVSQQEKHIQQHSQPLPENFLGISLIKMNIFSWQGKVIIFAIKKKSIFSLEKQMYYQSKCLYELGETVKVALSFEISIICALQGDGLAYLGTLFSNTPRLFGVLCPPLYFEQM